MDLNLNKRVNKKGFFFTFIAIVVLSIFMVVFSFKSEIPYDNFEIQKPQIKVANAFIKDIEEVYLNRVLYTSGIKVLNAMENEIEVNGKIDDVEIAAESLLLYGEWPLGASEPIMINHTLLNWSDKITTMAWNDFKIKVNLIFHEVRVRQDSPWSISFETDVTIFLNYSETSFLVGEEILVNISLLDRRDPLFIQRSHFLGVDSDRLIKKVYIEEWNYSTIINHIDDQTFEYSNFAPNYIMRMENDSGYSSCCGIESFMNNSYKQNYSYIDHQFFSQTNWCPINLYNLTDVWDDVSGIGEQFKIDILHLSQYGYSVSDSEAERISCP